MDTSDSGDLTSDANSGPPEDPPPADIDALTHKSRIEHRTQAADVAASEASPDRIDDIEESESGTDKLSATDRFVPPEQHGDSDGQPPGGGTVGPRDVVPLDPEDDTEQRRPDNAQEAPGAVRVEPFHAKVADEYRTQSTMEVDREVGASPVSVGPDTPGPPWVIDTHGRPPGPKR